MAALAYEYALELSFEGMARRHSFTLRCVPQDTLRQRVVSCTTLISPDVRVTESRDSYGNVLLEGTVSCDHGMFSVLSGGSVLVPGGDPDYPVPEEEERPGEAMVFRHQSGKTAAGPAVRGFLGSAPACACGPLERAVGLMHRLHSSFEYRKGVTDASTTAEQAMALGAGVCQDYAHILISLLREEGIPARYVVGFTAGEGESHAWVEVLHGGRWYGLDPTGGCLVGPRHIKVSHGRDYDDCRINRGVFYGARVSQQQARASVTPVGEMVR